MTIRKQAEGIFGMPAIYEQFKSAEEVYRKGPNWGGSLTQAEIEAELHGRWFETDADTFDHFMDLLPPLIMEFGWFAMCERTTGAVTSCFYQVLLGTHVRYAHAYVALRNKDDGRAVGHAIRNAMAAERIAAGKSEVA
jgi:hypothetical protein